MEMNEWGFIDRIPQLRIKTGFESLKGKQKVVKVTNQQKM
jgi:hypothetical protein